MSTQTIPDCIEFDDDELDAAAKWHDGQSSMLYAIASTGSLRRGTERYRPHVECSCNHERNTVMRKYIPCDESEIPPGTRFDVPARNQGQAIEVAYAFASPKRRSAADEGDKYKRVTDHSVGPRAVRYFKLAAILLAMALATPADAGPRHARKAPSPARIAAAAFVRDCVHERTGPTDGLSAPIATRLCKAMSRVHDAIAACEQAVVDACVEQCTDTVHGCDCEDEALSHEFAATCSMRPVAAK